MVNFDAVRTPAIHFGAGRLRELPELAGGILAGDAPRKILLITGQSSFRKKEAWSRLTASLKQNGFPLADAAVTGEPSPDLIDKLCDEHRADPPGLVVAIGGGSVLDTGKALAAMLPLNESVMEYLEGVGSGRKHPGIRLPFIAVPTTSGTGSEATKNAVLSRVGENGFKKSLRHDNFVPDMAILDPELSAGSPAALSAASGMDAFTQLLESWVSVKASPFTDGLAWSGLEAVAGSLEVAVREDPNDLEARAALAYGACFSGITLANAGLGVVHGLASSLGGRFHIPHGALCGTLLAEAVRMTVAKLAHSDEAGLPALARYARVGMLMGAEPGMTLLGKCEVLADALQGWTERLGMPRLGEYGLTEETIPELAEKTGNKNNPIALDSAEIAELLRNRL